jgi:hypothetical protein
MGRTKLVASAIAIPAVAACVVATTGQAESPTPEAANPDQLSVLDRPLTSDDALSQKVIAALEDSPGTIGTADWTQARRAGESLWLVRSGTNTLCLHAGAGSSTVTGCGPLSGAARGGATVTYRQAGRTQIAGAVPDGVDAVSVGFADGSSRQLAVANNGFSGSFSSPPDSVAFDGPAGPQSAPVATTAPRRTSKTRKRH